MVEKATACERESLCAEVEKLDSEREAGHGRGKLGMGEKSWAWERRFWVRERKKKGSYLPKRVCAGIMDRSGAMALFT